MATEAQLIKFPRRRRAHGGFTQVPNDLIAACMSRHFRGPKGVLLLAVCRLTLGWGKDRERLTLAQLAEEADMKESQVSAVLKQLEEMGALEVIYTRQGRVLGLIENYAELLDKLDSKEECKPSLSVKSEECRPSLSVNPEVNSPLSPSYIDKESIKEKEEARADAQAAPAPVEKPKKKPRSKKLTFDQFVADTKAKGEILIPEDHPAFSFADNNGIPHEWLRVAWCEFRDRHRGTPKTYIDWRLAFNNCVRSNWYDIWTIDRATGEAKLTPKGAMLLRDLQAKEAAK